MCAREGGGDIHNKYTCCDISPGLGHVLRRYERLLRILQQENNPKKVVLSRIINKLSSNTMGCLARGYKKERIELEMEEEPVIDSLIVPCVPHDQSDKEHRINLNEIIRVYKEHFGLIRHFEILGSNNFRDILNVRLQTGDVEENE